MTEEWGFADLYSMEPKESSEGPLEDIKGDDWRNILVVGRATKEGVYGETLALVGRARYLADELGCRVEVLLMGDELEAATKVLQQYAIHTIYRVQAPQYAPIDHTAKVLEQVVRKRRPELILAFQSRTGDAVVAYAANRLGVGYVIGAKQVELDTASRLVVATHTATNEAFETVTSMARYPQFITVQRGLFRAPMEDPYANVNVHDLEVDVGPLADIRVLEKRPPPSPTLENAERVVVVGARVQDRKEIDAARRLAVRLDAVFAVTRSIIDRGLAEDEGLVGELETHIHQRLLVTIGVRGTLDFLEGIRGDPTIAALASEPDDPIAKKAAYLVQGTVVEAVDAVLDAM